MKVRLTFKTPDVTYDALHDEALSDKDHNKLERLFMKFIEFDEYLTVEFDTEAGTAKVVEKH